MMNIPCQIAFIISCHVDKLEYDKTMYTFRHYVADQGKCKI